MSGLVSDFYDTEEEFEDALHSAECNAVSEREMSFIDSLHEKFEQYGMRMFLSQKQADWLDWLSEGS